jgi:type II restriction enzyme
MRLSETSQTIFDLCEDSSLTFTGRTTKIIRSVLSSNLSEVLEHLDGAGIIPESFGHDSTHEKLFAKYSDAVLAHALSFLGMKSSVLEERADSADVVAELDDHTLVGDAKAFRLSRTAKNQKDFKVEALNQWRKGADYAVLLAPLYQYPKQNSQIYSQACRYNVTLFSYTHLAFLLRNKPEQPEELRALWEIAGSIPPTTKARIYWTAIETKLLEITRRNQSDMRKAIRDTYASLPEQAEEQVRYWEVEKQRLQELPHDKAVDELIKALKIDSKIEVIRRNARPPS